MMKRAAFFLAGLLALSVSLTAGRFELGLGGGFFTHRTESGAVLGISPGFRIARTVALETEFFQYPGGLEGGSLSNLGLTLLVGPSPWESRKTAPYLALGVAVFEENGALESTLEGPFLSVGGGLKTRLSGKFSLYLDGRYFVQLIGDEYPAFKNLLRLTIGISFRL